MTIFTVKWCYRTQGVDRERILETDAVAVAYHNVVSGGSTVSQKLGVYNVPSKGIVVIGNPYEGADSMAFIWGTIYVMNRDGRTIAKYVLDQDCPDYDSLATERTAYPDGILARAA